MERYGAGRVSRSVDDVAGDRIDVLDVATHPAYRLDAVRAAVAAGIPVVNLEKPYALTRTDADEINELAATSGCRIVVNHQKPFLPAFAAAESAVRDGRLGPVRFIRATCQGSPADQGTHLLDLVLRLLDAAASGGRSDTVRVTAAATGRLEPGCLTAEDLAVNLVAGEVRVLVTMGTAGWTMLPGGHPLQQFGLEVLGQDGWLEAGMCTRFRRISFSGKETEDVPTSWEEHFRSAQTAHCALLLRMLEEPALAHPAALSRARPGLEILFAAQDSALTHAAVQVPLDPPAGQAPSAERSPGTG
jgi:predicted dehydrogenase